MCYALLKLIIVPNVIIADYYHPSVMISEINPTTVSKQNDFDMMSGKETSQWPVKVSRSKVDDSGRDRRLPPKTPAPTKIITI